MDTTKIADEVDDSMIYDEALTATHVTPTESGRWLVFVEGKGFPVALLDTFPETPVVVVESDVSVFLDPSEFAVEADPVFGPEAAAHAQAVAA